MIVGLLQLGISLMSWYFFDAHGGFKIMICIAQYTNLTLLGCDFVVALELHNEVSERRSTLLGANSWIYAVSTMNIWAC